MLQNAISKLKTEMEQSNNNPYIQVVGEFLLKHLVSNPGSAELINNPDKTIGGSLDAMKKEAEKKKVGSCAVLTDDEGFAVVLKYFGIEPATESKPKPAFDVSLDDLLKE